KDPINCQHFKLNVTVLKNASDLKVDDTVVTVGVQPNFKPCGGFSFGIFRVKSYITKKTKNIYNSLPCSQQGCGLGQVIYLFIYF
ncbi:hypothetical protein J4Q44_G00192440, partial [Coregonus suidteri]